MKSNPLYDPFLTLVVRAHPILSLSSVLGYIREGLLSFPHNSLPNIVTPGRDFALERVWTHVKPIRIIKDIQGDFLSPRIQRFLKLKSPK